MQNMQLTILFLVFLYTKEVSSHHRHGFHISDAHFQGPGTCNLPWGDIGLCIPYFKCTTIPPGSFHDFKTNQCGFETYTPIICCPRADNFKNPRDLHFPYEEPKNPGSCDLPWGDIGSCTPFFKCATVSNNYYKYKTEVCGFERRVICCPDKDQHEYKDEVIPKETAFIDRGDEAITTIGIECGNSKPKVSDHLSHTSGFKSLPYVVGGSETLVGKYPWMAIVGKQSNQEPAWICDGVLVHPQWVISAAHCVLKKEKYIVRLGEHDISRTDEGSTPTDYSVAEIIFHPDFKLEIGYHDLVLLKLNESITVQRFVQPICLPNIQNDIISQKATLAGWGAETFGGNLSNVLREAVVSIFNVSVCDKSYSKLSQYSDLWPQGIVEKYILCAGGKNGGIDACQGDSGGPLMIKQKGKYELIGVVSKGFGCGLKDFPGIYVNLQSYITWILDTTSSNQF